MAQSPVLACEGLTKRYGSATAVEALSLTIAEGETYGLLGPNGAGKTTAISMIIGILKKDAGRVLIDGSEPSKKTKALIGYVPQDMGLYFELTARENLRFFARLYGIAGTRRVEQVLELTGLSDRADDVVSTYSGGMSRRLNIAIGLLNQPRLLVLDEPTAGVDPQSRNSILDTVKRLAAEGAAVLYTTHYMEEAERLCDRVGILDRGRMIAEGTRRELVAMVGERDRVVLGVDGDVARAVQELGRFGTAREHEGRVELLVANAAEKLPELLAAVGRVRSVEVREPDLEAVFLHLTGRALRD